VKPGSMGVATTITLARSVLEYFILYIVALWQWQMFNIKQSCGGASCEVRKCVVKIYVYNSGGKRTGNATEMH